ncbi:hypothetical protein AWB64_00941 [Caballeronia sordidicola]|uniref:Uncharacterized protein n=1 Tax=Caballeronia sordidicola TaxID=196367 RepID=A0A158F8S3_CABSO|nr:hypothetical protein [Caballeronia sordidicola]SAL16131.1 hypothetical protein AWB64_00941 [Caballeronia sordidicola]
MEDTIYTKGIYTATIGVRPTDDGQFQGVVTLVRDDGGDGEDSEPKTYDVAATSLSEEEALEEARALAHRILGEIEL